MMMMIVLSAVLARLLAIFRFNMPARRQAGGQGEGGRDGGG